MARASVINRDLKRRDTVKKYAAKRAGLQAIIANIKLSDEQRFAARQKLQALPRDNQPAQTAELLTLLITPEPLPGIKLSEEPVELAAATVAEWEQKWGAPAERLELVGGAGRAYTKAEKAAGSGGRLTSADPMPQTIYRVSTKPGNPMLITVPLRIVR